MAHKSKYLILSFHCALFSQSIIRRSRFINQSKHLISYLASSQGKNKEPHYFSNVFSNWRFKIPWSSLKSTLMLTLIVSIISTSLYLHCSIHHHQDIVVLSTDLILTTFYFSFVTFYLYLCILYIISFIIASLVDNVATTPTNSSTTGSEWIVQFLNNQKENYHSRYILWNNY